MGQEIRHALGGCLWLSVFHKVQSKGQRVCSHKSARGGSTSKFTHVAVGRNQFLVSSWPESLTSLLVVEHMPPSVPCRMGFAIVWLMK